MKTNKFLLGLVVASSLLFTSCPEGVEEITVEEAKTLLAEDGKNLNTDLNEMIDLEGTVVLTNFANKMETVQIKGGKSIAKTLLKLSNPTINKDLKKSFKLDVPEEALELKYGTYTWSSSINNWEYSATEPTDKWVFLFPAYETSTTNDAKVTMDIEGEIIGQEFLPNQVEATLEVNEEKLIEVSAKINFVEMENNVLPTSAELYVYNKPFSYNAKLNGSIAGENITAGIEFTLKKDSEVIIATDLNVNIVEEETTDEYLGQTITTYTYIPVVIDGYFQFYNFKIDGKADVSNLITLGENEIPTQDQINTAIDFDLLHVPTNTKMADIALSVNPLFNEITPGVMPVVVTLKFIDGSEEDFFTYFSEVFMTIALLEMSL